MVGVAQRKSTACKAVCHGFESRPDLHMAPSGHGFSLFPVRLGARSSAGPPRQCRAADERHPNFILFTNRKTPRKDGAAAGGIPLPRGLSFLILFRRLDRKEIRGSNLHLAIQMQRPLGAHPGPGLLDTLCPPIRPDLSNGIISSSRETNNSLMHGRPCPRRAESRYQPQGRTMRLARRVRICRCKNQRGWAREFLTVFDLKKRDVLQRL